MVFTEESTVAAFLLRARREGLRDFGACMSPMNAFQILQESRPVGANGSPRRERPQGADFLQGHELVSRVAYPDLESHPDHLLARRILPRGSGAVFSLTNSMSIAPAGRRSSRASRFSRTSPMSRYPLAGDPSCIHYPLQEDAAALREAGIGEGTLRLSIGLEDADDLSPTSSALEAAAP